MKVAAFQAPMQFDSMDAVIQLIVEQVHICESQGVEVLCCPEGILGGLADYVPRPADIAIDIPSGRLQTMLAPIASETVSTIVGFTERGANGQLFNSAAIFVKGEIAGVYRKRHPAINRSLYEPGSTAPIFRVGDLIFGVVICRDSLFPDLVQDIANLGGAALFVPTNNGLPPTKGGVQVVHEARHADISTAREHRLCVIRADVAGQCGGFISYGASAIVDRDGTVLQSARPLETELLVAETQVGVAMAAPKYD